jgi:hypothetical protein
MTRVCHKRRSFAANSSQFFTEEAQVPVDAPSLCGRCLHQCNLAGSD